MIRWSATPARIATLGLLMAMLVVGPGIGMSCDDKATSPWGTVVASPAGLWALDLEEVPRITRSVLTIPTTFGPGISGEGTVMLVDHAGRLFGPIADRVPVLPGNLDAPVAYHRTDSLAWVADNRLYRYQIGAGINGLQLIHPAADIDHIALSGSGTVYGIDESTTPPELIAFDAGTQSRLLVTPLPGISEPIHALVIRQAQAWILTASSIAAVNPLTGVIDAQFPLDQQPAGTVPISLHLTDGGGSLFATVVFRDTRGHWSVTYRASDGMAGDPTYASLRVTGLDETGWQQHSLQFVGEGGYRTFGYRDANAPPIDQAFWTAGDAYSDGNMLYRSAMRVGEERMTFQQPTVGLTSDRYALYTVDRATNNLLELQATFNGYVYFDRGPINAPAGIDAIDFLHGHPDDQIRIAYWGNGRVFRSIYSIDLGTLEPATMVDVIGRLRAMEAGYMLEAETGTIWFMPSEAPPVLIDPGARTYRAITVRETPDGETPPIEILLDGGPDDAYRPVLLQFTGDRGGVPTLPGEPVGVYSFENHAPATDMARAPDGTLWLVRGDQLIKTTVSEQRIVEETLVTIPDRELLAIAAPRSANELRILARTSGAGDVVLIRVDRTSRSILGEESVDPQGPLAGVDPSLLHPYRHALGPEYAADDLLPGELGVAR